MVRFWGSALVCKVIWPNFPPFRHTPPAVFTWPSIPRAYAGAGLGRRSSITLSIFRNSSLRTDTSAIWSVTYRPWRTILAPILTSFPGASSTASARPPRAAPTSPFGYKQTSSRLKLRSALPPAADVPVTTAGLPVLTDTVAKVAPAERRRNIVIRNLARLNHCCGRRRPGELLLRVRPSKIDYQQYRPKAEVMRFDQRGFPSSSNAFDGTVRQTRTGLRNSIIGRSRTAS